MENFKNKYNYIIEMKLTMKCNGKLVSKKRFVFFSMHLLRFIKVIFTICIIMKPSPRLSIHCWSSTHENIQMWWILDLNSRDQHLVFEVNSQHIWVIHHDLDFRLLIFVTKDVFVVMEALVKNQCKKKTHKLSPFCPSLLVC